MHEAVHGKTLINKTHWDTTTCDISNDVTQACPNKLDSPQVLKSISRTMHYQSVHIILLSFSKVHGL